MTMKCWQNTFPYGKFHTKTCFDTEVTQKWTISVKDAVIQLEIGSSKSRDSHSQKPASPSDKRVSPIQHFSSFSVRHALLPLWDVHSFVTRQFPRN